MADVNQKLDPRLDKILRQLEVFEPNLAGMVRNMIALRGCLSQAPDPARKHLGNRKLQIMK